VKLTEYAAHMRAAGVRRVVFPSGCTFDAPDSSWASLTEIELEPAHPDTIPAPGFDPGDVSEPEEKAAGTCAIPGCQEKAGFHFAPHMCERHGLSQLGVKT